MTTKNKKKGLGTSLADILEKNTQENNYFDFSELEQISPDETVHEVEVELIEPNPYQPRVYFDQDKLDELAKSIKQTGVFTPILLKRVANDRYQLIAGERRLRASKLANKKTIPAVIREFSNEQMAEIGLLENIQRADLNVMEEALAYYDLIKILNISQEQLAQKVHKSRSHIANVMRLLKLSPKVQEAVRYEKISMGHARALINLEPQKQLIITNQIIDQNLNVRQLEKLVNNLNTKKQNSSKEQLNTEIENWLFEEELNLKQKYGTNVSIKYKNRGTGKIILDFYSQDDLTRILKILKKRS